MVTANLAYDGSGATTLTTVAYDHNASGAITIDASGVNAISIGSDTDTGAINIGSGASARTITVGNDASTKVDLNALIIELDSAGSIVTDSVTTTTMTSTGNFNIDASDSASINIGTSSNTSYNNSDINIGTSVSARTIQIGNAASTSLNLDAAALNLTSVNTMKLTDGEAILNFNGSGKTNLTTVDYDHISTGAININATGSVDIISNTSGNGEIKFRTGYSSLELDISGGKNTKFSINSTENNVITFPDITDTLVSKNAVDILTNKTLTSPIINQINDENGKKILILESITSINNAIPVNVLKISNSATTFGPIIEPSGDDDNISLNLKSKGTGKIKFYNNVDLTSGIILKDQQISGNKINGGTISTIEIDNLIVPNFISKLPTLIADNSISGNKIKGGTIDTLNISDLTISYGDTLDIRSGELLLSDKQINGDKINDGTIDSIAITDLVSTNITSTALSISSSGALSIDSTDDSNLTVTGDGKDLDIAVAGGGTQELRLASAGTAATALQISTSAGGMDITVAGADADQDLDITSNTSINITAAEAHADAIVINASNAAGGINVDSGTGGIDVDSTGTVNIASSKDGASALVLTASAGGVDITATGAAADEDINITATGSSINLTSTEADANAIVIDASDTAGGINIDSGTAGIDVDSTGTINIASSKDGASALVLTASAGGVDIIATAAAGEDINITATGSSINLTSTEADANAIVINASDTTGGINIDSGTGGIAIDTTGVLSIDSAGGASNISHTATADGDFNIAMDGAVDASLILSSTGTGADALQVTASAGGMDITSAGVMDITTSANNSNITLTPHGTGLVSVGNTQFANDGYIADANGNEIVLFGTTTSAVNGIIIANSASGNGPSITAQGDDD